MCLTSLKNVVHKILIHVLMLLYRELTSLEKAGIPRGWKEYWKWRRHRKRIVQETLERYSDIQHEKKSLKDVLQEITNNAKWLKEKSR